MRAKAASVLREDPVMAELLERHDPYDGREREPFERLCVSIINQQLSTASAAAVRERVFEFHIGTVGRWSEGSLTNTLASANPKAYIRTC